VAQGLLPKTSKNKDLEDLNKALRDPHLDRSMKLGVLKVLSQKTQELFPNYNKNIGLLTNYLKNILQEEKNPLYQKVIQFILYTYFQAYKECPITSEQAGLYALNLSSDDTPEAFRIKITTDEDLEEEIEATSPQETQENTEHKGFPVVREEEHTGNLSPEDTLGALSVPISPNENLQEILPESLPVTPENTEAKVSIKEIPQIPVESFQPKLIPQIPKFSSNQPTDNGINLMKENLTRQTGIVVAPPPAVVPNPLPVINSKRARNLDRAQLLLEKLEKKRGKIEQKEVTNMLRRLDYTFQPTADHGLTLHLGHKGRKNKKGTPGVLKKGQISDLILVLRDVINKAEPQ
jgi:hypothetical protein